MVLILTVGKNILPVAVAGRQLISTIKPRRVILVHSRESAPEALRLSTFLAADQVTIVRLPIPSDPTDDVTTIEDEIGGAPSHLHYSGGTTAMVEQVQRARRWQGPSSYLSLKTNRLLSGNGTPLVKGDLRAQVHLSVPTIANLHGWYVVLGSKGGGSIVPLTDRFAQLALIHETSPSEFDSFPKNSRSTERLDAHTEVCCKNERVAVFINQVLPNRFFLFDTLGRPRWSAKFSGRDTAEVSEYWDLRDFVHGGWFQFRVESALQEALTRHGCGELLCNAFFTRTTDGIISENKDAFEIDILFPYGYQLVLVSCTSKASSTEVKLKAFEALHRARQLGGAGARAIVVSRAGQAPVKQDNESLHLDIGLGPKEHHGSPIEIWGADKVADLSREFSLYLDRLTHDDYAQ